MSRKEDIKNAYKSLGKAHNIYDGQMLGSTRLGRFMLMHVWQMTRDDALEYQARVFTAIPEDFSGKLLEVPVGTGVLSMPIFKTLPEAEITCLDYSEKMMAAAKQRAQDMGVDHVTFRQGDVGQLPYEDDTFDVVLSLNGFHAFPDKDAAYRETYRVLKPGGTFTGCFYVEKANRHTDRIIRMFYIRMGFFTPPFETVASLRYRLATMYRDVEVTNVGSIAVFHCVK